MGGRGGEAEVGEWGKKRRATGGGEAGRANDTALEAVASGYGHGGCGVGA